VLSAYKRTAAYRRYAQRRELYGASDVFARSALRRVYDQSRYGSLGYHIWFSRRIPGWTKGAEVVELARVSASLPENAVVVEIGSFLGRSAVLLAGARKVRGSGTVHCVDAFDGSGDAFSTPIYDAIREAGRLPLRERFNRNIHQAGLSEWVQVHSGRAGDVADAWTQPIDFLFLDADQSCPGVRALYAKWSRHLKSGGIIAIHNSTASDTQDASHSGPTRLVQQMIRSPEYTPIWCMSSTTFAQKV